MKLSADDISDNIETAMDSAFAEAVANRKLHEAAWLAEYGEPRKTIGFSFGLIYHGRGEFSAEMSFEEDDSMTIMCRSTSIESSSGKAISAVLAGEKDRDTLTDEYDYQKWTENRSWDEDLSYVLENGYSDETVDEDE
jgi:hypothetical protein